MHPTARLLTSRLARFPRARGDAPTYTSRPRPPARFSPRARGCTRRRSPACTSRLVFPARAGMHPTPSSPTRRLSRFPRARGDAPDSASDDEARIKFSPRARGCTLLLLGKAGEIFVFPARAGMHPRGKAFSFAASSFPRARGDAPSLLRVHGRYALFSPRARGCTHAPPGRARRPAVFPARAGMHPSWSPSRLRPHSFPRARGDAPSKCKRAGPPSPFSPRARGCTLVYRVITSTGGVFPARAGMHPIPIGRRWAPRGFPRARGSPLENLKAERSEAQVFKPCKYGTLCHNCKDAAEAPRTDCP